MIKKNDILLDVLDHHPQTLQIVRRYENQLNTCICCAMLFSSIEEICEHYHLELKILLDQLNSSSTPY